MQILCGGSLGISDDLISFLEKFIVNKMADVGHFENFWVQYLMNRWLDRIKIWCGGSLGNFDDLITFWEESIKYKMADQGHFDENSHPKNLWARYLMNCWLDRIQI